MTLTCRAKPIATLLGLFRFFYLFTCSHGVTVTVVNVMVVNLLLIFICIMFYAMKVLHDRF